MLPRISGIPSSPDPMTITFELGDFDSSRVASMPLIFNKLFVKLLLMMLFARDSPSAAILFLSASLFSLSKPILVSECLLLLLQFAFNSHADLVRQFDRTDQHAPWHRHSLGSALSQFLISRCFLLQLFLWNKFPLQCTGPIPDGSLILLLVSQDD